MFVVDARVGATATDERVVQLLRRTNKAVFLVANKVDDAIQEPEAAALWSLGLGEPWPVSALHGRGVADLLDAVLKVLPDESAVAKPVLGGPRRVAILGRPNVGKSSLLNKAAGEERVVVNDLAGTTRDPVDEQVEIAGRVWTFVDTAGIRRRVRAVEKENSSIRWRHFAHLSTPEAHRPCSSWTRSATTGARSIPVTDRAPLSIQADFSRFYATPHQSTRNDAMVRANRGMDGRSSHSSTACALPPSAP